MRENCLKIYKLFRSCYTVFNPPPKRLFTSYLCNKNDEIIQSILQQWKVYNPDFEICYFSDDDVHNFFKNHTPNFELVSKMKNGVAKADFFRICYIQIFGGYWFDLDLQPQKVCVPSYGSVHLFDCGFKNISYMFIGGSPNQPLFQTIIEKIAENIQSQIPKKTKHVMHITGPRIIQNILFDKLNIINKDGCFSGTETPHLYLCNTSNEFVYKKHLFQNYKTNLYQILQRKYKKTAYQHYDFI